MTDALFNQSNTSTTDTTTVAPVEALVGEGKKFKTIEDLAKGKLEADAYIEQLKAQNAALQKDASERELLETLVARLENGTEHNSSNQSNLSNDPSDQQTTSTPNIPDIDSIVERKLSEIESKRIRVSNLEKFKAESRKVLGDTWETTLKGQMERLGLDEATLVTIATKSPEAALKALGYTASESFVRPINSAIQAQTGVGNGNIRNFAYYENMRKTNPKAYNTAATQSEIHKAALALKDKFYT